MLTFSSQLYNLSKHFSKEEAYIPTLLCRTEMIMKTMGVTATSTSLERIIIVASRDWKTLFNSYLNRALAFQNHRVLLFTGPKACRLLIINS